jgi:uncharacterized protein YjbJ (UPF0337 family)
MGRYFGRSRASLDCARFFVKAVPELARCSDVPRTATPTDQNPKESAMNWDRIEGNWKQFKGKAREQWGDLTDDDLDVVEGKRQQLAGKIQERYGLAKDEAERQIDDWLERMH